MPKDAKLDKYKCSDLYFASSILKHSSIMLIL
jgi:hypothetical protein